jgi:hypothetical protein
MPETRMRSAGTARLLLAAPDTLHISSDMQISDEVRAKLEREKQAAQEADKVAVCAE